MIAQALGEYATISTLVDGVRSIGEYLSEVAREWGFTGALIVVASAITWRLVTRIK
jgi:hypothetical protein